MHATSLDKKFKQNVSVQINKFRRLLDNKIGVDEQNQFLTHFSKSVEPPELLNREDRFDLFLFFGV